MRVFACVQFVALSATLLAAQNLEFDVASIKLKTTGQLPVGPPPNAPGQIVDRSVPALVLLRRAYPGVTIVDYPNWVELERYDVEVRFSASSSSEQLVQMWRSLLADRMKLQVRPDTRQRPAYRLVRSRNDGTLGPQLKPSTLKCDPPDPTKRVDTPVEVQNAFMATFRDRRAATPQEEALMQSQCRVMVNAWQTLYAGAIEIKQLIIGFNFFGAPLGRPVVDATGLEGLFAVKLWADAKTVDPPPADAPPSLFSALPDQLGLKLEPTTTQDQVLVVEHIERPLAN